MDAEFYKRVCATADELNYSMRKKYGDMKVIAIEEENKPKERIPIINTPLEDFDHRRQTKKT
tara:strand:- start:2531 stop:2716 length:186 start_codon:yes stop_codon:yes gene_type:complete